MGAVTSAMASYAAKRGLESVLTPNEGRRLRKRVEKTAGVRLGRWFEALVYDQEVFQVLCLPYETAIGRLVELVARAGARSHRWQRGGLATAEVTSRVADAMYSGLLAVLSPADSRNTLDARQAARLDTLLAAVQFSRELTTQELRHFPLAVRVSIARAGAPDVSTSRALEQVRRQGAVETVGDLVAATDGWFLSASGSCLEILAELVTAHGRLDLAASLRERAAATGYQRARMLGLAAFAYQVDQRPDERDRCLEQIGAASEPYADLVRALAANDHSAAAQHARTLSMRSGDELRGSILEIQSLLTADGFDRIDPLVQEYVSKWPDSSAGQIFAAVVALGNYRRDPDTYSTKTLREIARLAGRARQLVREWGGSSREAAALGAQAALDLEDFALATKFAFTPPRGEATALEASMPELQLLRVYMSLDQSVSDGLDVELEGFPRALAHAMHLARSGSSDSQAAFGAAYELAEGAEQKFAVWSAVADVPTLDIPGEALRASAVTTSELAWLDARRLRAAGNLDGAITRALSCRTDERCCAFAAGALETAGEIDRVLVLLSEMRHRFSTLVYGAHWLRLAEKCERRPPDYDEVLDEASAAVPLGDDNYAFITELVLRRLAERHEWIPLEGAARRVIRDFAEGAGIAEWWLLLALLNQGRSGEAWETFRHRLPVPRNAYHARMLVALEREHGDSEGFVARMKALWEEYKPNESLQQDMAAALLVKPTSTTESDEDVLWARAFVSEASSEDPLSTGLRSITVGDSAQEILDQLESFVPQPNPAIESIEQQQRLGLAPLGLVALVHRRPYSLALASRWPNGLLVSEGPIDQRELTAARLSLTSTTVRDLSSMMIATLVDDVELVARSLMAHVVTVAESQLDARLAARDHAGSSDLSIIRDPQDGRLRPVQRSEAESLRIGRALDGLVRIANETVVDSGKRPELAPGTPVELQNAAWHAALELCKAKGATLWADDLGLRRLALSANVPAFGTLALASVLEDAGHVEPGFLEKVAYEMFNENCHVIELDLALDLAKRASLGRDVGPILSALSHPMQWVVDALGAGRAYLEALRNPQILSIAKPSEWLAHALAGRSRAGIGTASGPQGVDVFAASAVMLSTEPGEVAALFEVLVAANAVEVRDEVTIAAAARLVGLLREGANENEVAGLAVTAASTSAQTFRDAVMQALLR